MHPDIKSTEESDEKRESDYLKLTEELRQQLKDRSFYLYGGFGLFGLICIIFALMFAYKQRNKKITSATTQTFDESNKDGNPKENQNLDGVPEGEFLPVDEEKERLKQQIEELEEKIREITNNVKRSLVLKPFPLPPNKQTHVFLT
eukprot:CAMPEP_0173149128 /NCGR_PEP_ID=MMETSP1105-20130129/10141_1 /TAXON_ID=2985 /ORGANISM="Ochromonas sp., Strain BG-1" /LENGTH=145 /DNA_ID=CAMNT_0014063935 /DNA_START=321 /DNA_END=755 /DNA_ORIENTATION=-